VDDEIAVQLPNVSSVHIGLNESNVAIQRKTTAEIDAEMRDHVINGLSYLLTSNSDVGLKHFLPLGYDADPAVRGIFCHVVARVMETGAKFESTNESLTTGKRMRIGEVR
jgi:neurofibromin 1